VYGVLLTILLLGSNETTGVDAALFTLDGAVELEIAPTEETVVGVTLLMILIGGLTKVVPGC